MSLEIDNSQIGHSFFEKRVPYISLISSDMHQSVFAVQGDLKIFIAIHCKIYIYIWVNVNPNPEMNVALEILRVKSALRGVLFTLDVKVARHSF